MEVKGAWIKSSVGGPKIPQISQIVRRRWSQLQSVCRCQFPTLGNGRSQTLQRSNDLYVFQSHKGATSGFFYFEWEEGKRRLWTTV